jgi:uncharacterized Zn finger protein (UPF0148 family)
MTCRYCGTALPDGALFCGECGQPVAAVHEAPPRATGFSIADLAFSSPGDTSEPDDDDRDLPDGSPLGEDDPVRSAAHCPQCGEAMATGDVFCGECGFVLRTVSPPSGADLIDVDEFPADVERKPEPEPEPSAGFDAHEPEAGDADATTEVEPLDGSGHDDRDGHAERADADADVERAGAEAGEVEPAPGMDPDLVFDDPLAFPEPEVEPAAKPSPRSRPIPDPFPWGTDQPLREDLEATRLVADSAPGTRYVLQFSTGESVTVAGSGLIGRNPSMQPGEYVDQLVPIFDAGKSVSKTHLEFGQEAGRFWVGDRYSTNGSVIRQPDAEPRRCEAGRRYFIARGTRVDVGEQFFVVS